MVESILFDISIIIAAATILAYLAKLFKQPLIPGYIIAGIIIGPVGIALITNIELISILAELGIALLLFIVGLELNFKRLKNMGRVSSVIGIVQVVIMLGIGYLIAVFLGFIQTEAIYIGLIVAFSSTMVVIKLLYDKNELDTLHGRMMLGILLVQDILVILALAILINLDNLSLVNISSSLLSGFGLLAISIIGGRLILKPLFRFIADSQELLFLFALSWCLVFVALSYHTGFSIAIGAFIAGIGLAATPYTLEITSRLGPLKDFFIVLFFVSLGMETTLIFGTSILLLLLVLLGVTLLLKPFIIMLLTFAFKYGKKTSLQTSTGLAQISEFSLIIAAQGLLLNHISRELFSITILLAIVTFSISTYFIEFNNQIYKKTSNFLKIFERAIHEGKKLEKIPKKLNNHVIVCGCHRMGSRIIKTLQALNKKFIVIDYDPDIISNLIKQDVPCIYGDAGDIEILEKINFKGAKMIISTIPSNDVNMLILQMVKQTKSKAKTFVVATNLSQALSLYDQGVDYVIVPRVLSGEKIASIIENTTKEPSKLKKLQEDHLLHLEKLKEEEILEKYTPAFLKSIQEKFKRK